jgi:hypothetical protein
MSTLYRTDKCFPEIEEEMAKTESWTGEADEGLAIE